MNEERNDAHPELDRLSAELDGDLRGEERALVAAHLAQCARCQAELARLASMRGALAELPRPAPSPALFARIAQAQGATPRPRIGWTWLPIGAALAAAALAAVLWLPRDAAVTPPAPPSLAAPSATTPRAERAAKARAAVERAETTYRAAIAGLARAADDEQRKLAPKARAAVARSLAELDRAIERCRAVLGGAPDDPEAQAALLAAYGQKVRVLNAMLEEAL